METLKQHIDSQARGAVAHLRGRDKALATFGWTGERAAWIALVCLHSGAFTRAQCARFLDAHPEQVRRVVHALIAQGLAAEEPVPGIRGIGRVCRIYARTLYRALGAEHIRHRRDASPEVLMRRLLSLDYVIEHADQPWLATEAEKVAAFDSLGIGRGLLPVRVYRGAARTTRHHFPVKLPIALDAEHAVFVYADPGHRTATALRSWGAAHRELWLALQTRGRCVELVAVGRTSRELERARRVMRHWAEPSGPAELDPQVRKELARIERGHSRGRGPDPGGVRRSPGRHEAQRGAGETGPTAGRPRLNPPRQHMADRAPRRELATDERHATYGRTGVRETIAGVRFTLRRPGDSHGAFPPHPLARQRLALPRSRPASAVRGRHRPRRERPPSPRAWYGFGRRCVFTPLPPSLGVAPDPSIPTREGGLSAASRRRITRSPTGRPSGSRASPSKAGVPPMARATAQAAKSGTRPSQVTDGLPARDCWTGAISRRRVDGRAHPTLPDAVPGIERGGSLRSRPQAPARHRRSGGPWCNRKAASDIRNRWRAHRNGGSVHKHVDVDVHARYATDPRRQGVKIRPLEAGSSAMS